MAAPNKVVTLNIGSQSVTIAGFRTSSDGSILLDSHHSAHIPIEAQSDAARAMGVQVALMECAEAIGIKSGGKINYSISAQSVFTRFVKLPAVEEEKVEQIIQFEAQQNVPFPINEVVWDYQLVETDEDDKVEVALVAIKSDLLEEINGAVQSNKFLPEVVDVAPMALYNAFRFNYGELGGCTLIVDIGGRTTNLLFSEPHKVFSRSIPIGGSTITASISKELDISPAQAEAFKLQEGFVSLGGAYADPPDADIAKLSKIARNTMTRLHAEINRSIAFYRSQQQGSAPVRVFLAGGSCNLPYMREFFNEKLQIPIEYFNPLRNVAVTSNVNVTEIAKVAHTLGENVGLALRSNNECPMELNLVPPAVAERQRLDRKKPAIIFAAACFALLIAGWWFYFNQAAAIKSTALASVDAKVAELRSFEGQLREVRDSMAAVRQANQPFLQISQERQFWASIIEEVHSKLPEKFIWITTMEIPAAAASATPAAAQEPAEAQELLIQGLYLDNPRQTTVVDNFVAALTGSTLLNEPRVTKRSTPTQTEWAYEYEIQVGITPSTENQ